MPVACKNDLFHAIARRCRDVRAMDILSSSGIYLAPCLRLHHEDLPSLLADMDAMA